MKKYILSIMMLAGALATQAQEAPTTGFLLPRMTTAQKTALVNPAKGLTIYNTDTNVQEINTGTAAAPVWVQSASNTNSWSTNGNAGTTAGTNFIGTTDNVGLVFKVNNIQSGYINPTVKNTFFGMSSGSSTTTGDQSTGFGYEALKNQTTGSNNTAFGNLALSSVTTGDKNTAIGDLSLLSSTGSYNTAIGSGAGRFLTTGSNNIAIGYNVQLPSNTDSNQLNIGNVIYGTGLFGSLSGNIGIGTTNPISKLHIETSAGSAGVTVVSPNGNPRLLLANSATALNVKQFYMELDSTNNVGIIGAIQQTVATLPVVFKGKVNVGSTISPTEQLEVAGAIKIGTTTTATPAAGTIRFNTTTNKFEGYDGTAWVEFH